MVTDGIDRVRAERPLAPLLTGRTGRPRPRSSGRRRAAGMRSEPLGPRAAGRAAQRLVTAGQAARCTSRSGSERPGSGRRPCCPFEAYVGSDVQRSSSAACHSYKRHGPHKPWRRPLVFGHAGASQLCRCGGNGGCTGSIDAAVWPRVSSPSACSQQPCSRSMHWPCPAPPRPAAWANATRFRAGSTPAGASRCPRHRGWYL
jgi:hypothetical protein